MVARLFNSFTIAGFLGAGVLAAALTNLDAVESRAAAAPDKSATSNPDAAAGQFIAMHEAQVRPLEIALGMAWWTANTSGKDADFAAKVEAENRYDAALADRDRFAKLKAIHDGKVKDPILAREIELLYLAYLEKQVDPELLKRITSKANEIEKAFNVYRAKVADREIPDSEVRKILKESKDSKARQSVWESSKGVGKAVEADLRQLVFLRNEAARKLGFKDFHAMRFYLNEQSQEQVLKLFDELDALTREPFAAAKTEIDLKLAADYGIDVDELRPWHYHDPFFQESPGDFRHQPRQGVCQRRHPGAVPEVLHRHRTADRRRDRPQRPVRKAGQEPTCLLHRHRPRGRRARAGEHRAERVLDGHHAARVGAFGLQQQEHPA